MSDPRFQPRLMAAPSARHHFGKVVEMSWIKGSTDLEEKRIATARLQHALAVKITGRLREKGLNIRSYADLAGVSYDRMAKVLRGEALMRLEDVADAQRLLGAILPPMLEYRALPIPEPVGVEPAIDTVLRHREITKLLREFIAAELNSTNTSVPD